MMKVAGNQMDYEAVTSIYAHSLQLFKIAIGKG
jgi:flagellar basal body rod protein FlgB